MINVTYVLDGDLLNTAIGQVAQKMAMKFTFAHKMKMMPVNK